MRESSNEYRNDSEWLLDDLEDRDELECDLEFQSVARADVNREGRRLQGSNDKVRDHAHQDVVPQNSFVDPKLLATPFVNLLKEDVDPRVQLHHLDIVKALGRDVEALVLLI